MNEKTKSETKSKVKAKPQLIRVTLDETANYDDALKSLGLALMCIVCLHGEAAMMIDTAYTTDKETKTFLISVRGPLAIDLARVFIGFCVQAFGIEAVRVDHE